jgi:aspartate/methionine/tyrosine aminotransferase
MDFTNALNSKIRDVKPSGIRKFFDIVEEFEDVISLGIGEPDFQTPEHIIGFIGVEVLIEVPEEADDVGDLHPVV